MSLLSKEPALSAAGVLSAVSALFPVLAEYKVPVSPALQSLIVAVVTLALGWWVRQRVSPVSKDDGPKTPRSGAPLAAGSLMALALVACSTTPADRVRYGIAAVEMACEAAEKHPDQVPADVKERLAPVCEALEPPQEPVE